MHVVGTAGHVDHGKSTLVHALTGIDPDRFEEEKRRGLTIDLGFAWCTLPSGREIGIVDVPGHERFIRNMLAGVGGIDAAIFVVAADEGWMPQSAEHLQVLDFLDVRAGVVALTKCDLVSPDELELTVDDTWQHLRGTCLHDAEIVRVSGTTGAGLDELRGALDTLLAGTPPAPDRGRARLYVDRSFTIAGAGTVVTGTLTGGRLRVDDEVEVLPDGHRARIRTLQTHRRAVDEAIPGSRVAANLVGLGRAEVARGDAITHPGAWTTAASFATRLRTAWDMRHQLTERGAYELYLGSAEVGCDLKFLEQRSQSLVPVNAEHGLVAGLRADATTLVQVFARRPLPVEVGDRFIIRDTGRRATVAGGIVLDSEPGAIRRGDEAALRRLRAREGLSRTELALQIVAERIVVAIDDLASASGLSPDDVRGLVRSAADTGAIVAAQAFAVTADGAEDLAARARALVGAHHAAHPLEAGMSRDALRSELGIDPDALVELLALWPDLVGEGNVVRAADHGGALGGAERAAADRALNKLREGGASPPGLGEVGLPTDLAKALERLGELVFVTPDIAYAADSWAEIERKVAVLIARSGPATVAQVRDAVGTTRKYAVPLLERLDAVGITRRQGDRRELGPRGRELAGAHG